MRTSDVIGAVVYDSANVRLGKVHDLRVDRDGQRESDAPYAVSYLLVAWGTLATRLGYGYGHMHGPWPLSAVLRWAMHRRGYAVRWDQVASIDPDRQEVLLNARCEELLSAQAVLEESAT